MKDPQVLEALDGYEGYEPTRHATNRFVRKLQRVDFITSDTIDSWAYEYHGNPGGALVIASGRYERQVSAHKRGAKPSDGLRAGSGPHPRNYELI